MYQSALFYFIYLVPDCVTTGQSESESDIPPPKRIKTGMEPRSTTRTPLATFQGHKSTVTSVVWAGKSDGVWSDDDIVTGGWDNSIRIWDVATGINKNTLVSSRYFMSPHMTYHLGSVLTSSYSLL